jgi:hypothetical protein
MVDERGSAWRDPHDKRSAGVLTVAWSDRRSPMILTEAKLLARVYADPDDDEARRAGGDPRSGSAMSLESIIEARRRSQDVARPLFATTFLGCSRTAAA